MTVTTLDQHTALIVIDLQTGTASNPFLRPVAEIVAAANELSSAFRTHGQPVIFATVTGSTAGRTQYGGGEAKTWPAELTAPAPGLAIKPGDRTVSRPAWSAFIGTDLDGQLKAEGITQVVLAGVATSFGVESTARVAYDLGYSVVVVEDAVTDMRSESHEGSITRVFPVLGQTGSDAEIIGLLGS